MGDFWTSRSRWQALLVWGLLPAIALGCTSAGSTEPEPTAALVTPAMEQADAPTAVVLSAMELREGAPGVRLEIEAEGNLLWTQFRDADGDLVVEFPNSRPGPEMTGLERADGPVEEVSVETAGGGDRPLTRVRIHSREDVEHELVQEGNHLVVKLFPTDGVELTAVEEPYEPLAPAPETAQTPQVAALGTPDEPVSGPPVAASAATRLEEVWVDQEDQSSVIRVIGDGEFRYSTFALQSPERFVIDLTGVVNETSRSVIPVETELVERVRVAQFKAGPEAVARVVVDLAQPTYPWLERQGEELRIHFGGAQSDYSGETETQTTLAEDLTNGMASGENPEEPQEAPEETVSELQGDEEEVAWAEPAEDAEVPTEEIAPAAAMDEVPAEVIAQEFESEPIEGTVEMQPLVEPAAVEAPTPDPMDVELFEAQDVSDQPPVSMESDAPNYEIREVGGAETIYYGEPISMSLRDADIKEVLRTFAEISGLNLVIQPDVSGAVTVELTQVPWDQALDQILKINELGYELEGNIMRIARLERLAQEAQQEVDRQRAEAMAIPLRTVLKRVSYSGAGEVAGLLISAGGGSGGGILSERGSVTVDNRTNTLIIKELPAFMDTVLAVIEQLDVPEPQVMIEARIIETTKRFTRSLGINWGFDGVSDAAHGNTTGLTFPNNGSISGGVDLLTGGSNGFLGITMGNVLNTFTLDATLIAAEGEGLINILSSPKIATLNNERAEIQSGLQIPIQTIANNTVTVQFVNATLRLAVQPHVTAEGTVLMDIEIQKREPQLAFAVAGAANAPIATKEAKTRVIVRDGGTTVIGGIYEVSTDQGRDKVPGLANIPILGKLFQNQRRTDENQELLIFITPRVIRL